MTYFYLNDWTSEELLRIRDEINERLEHYED
jgi:hypothetical protein